MKGFLFDSSRFQFVLGFFFCFFLCSEFMILYHLLWGFFITGEGIFLIYFFFLFVVVFFLFVCVLYYILVVSA